jgi:hypothetical protein
MVPIYAISSLISLYAPSTSMVLMSIRDCYEAYVLYQFFTLLVTFLEMDSDNYQNALALKPPMRYPWPVAWFGAVWHKMRCRSGPSEPPMYKPGRAFVHECRRGILQFVFVKPVVSVSALVLDTTLDRYCDGDFSPTCGYLYATIINNISVSLALYYLVVFYQATKDELQPLKPVLKFVCVKSVLFFSYWQGVAIVILLQVGVLHDIGSYSAAQLAASIQNAVIVAEMLPFAIAHHWAFPSSVYVSEGYQVRDTSLDPTALRPRDAVVSGLRDVVSVTDVFDDAVASLRRVDKERPKPTSKNL